MLYWPTIGSPKNVGESLANAHNNHFYFSSKNFRVTGINFDENSYSEIVSDKSGELLLRQSIHFIDQYTLLVSSNDFGYPQPGAVLKYDVNGTLLGSLCEWGDIRDPKVIFPVSDTEVAVGSYDGIFVYDFNSGDKKGERFSNLNIIECTTTLSDSKTVLCTAVEKNTQHYKVLKWCPDGSCGTSYVPLTALEDTYIHGITALPDNTFLVVDRSEYRILRCGLDGRVDMWWDDWNTLLSVSVGIVKYFDGLVYMPVRETVIGELLNSTKSDNFVFVFFAISIFFSLLLLNGATGQKLTILTVFIFTIDGHPPIGSSK